MSDIVRFFITVLHAAPIDDGGTCGFVGAGNATHPQPLKRCGVLSLYRMARGSGLV
jgi:hypothetical protein